MANQISDVVTEVASVSALASADEVQIAEAARYVIARLGAEPFVALLHLESDWLASRGIVPPAHITVAHDEDLARNFAVIAAKVYVSACVALREALARLLANGTILCVTGDHPLASIRIEVTHPSATSSGRAELFARGIASISPTDCFRLRQVGTTTSSGTALDPDVFLADIASITPSAELAQCIREAFAALRNGLYLASVALMGMAAEIQLFEEAVRLAPKAPQVAKALNASHPQSLTVQTRLFDELRKTHGNEAVALQSQAEHMRQLRNYGVHLKPNQANPLAAQVAEVPCAALLLQLHSYLLRLHSLTSQRLAELT